VCGKGSSCLLGLRISCDVPIHYYYYYYYYYYFLPFSLSASLCPVAEENFRHNAKRKHISLA
jgi:hypothetical protein